MVRGDVKFSFNAHGLEIKLYYISLRIQKQSMDPVGSIANISFLDVTECAVVDPSVKSVDSAFFTGHRCISKFTGEKFIVYSESVKIDDHANRIKCNLISC